MNSKLRSAVKVDLFLCRAVSCVVSFQIVLGKTRSLQKPLWLPYVVEKVLWSLQEQTHVWLSCGTEALHQSSGGFNGVSFLARHHKTLSCSDGRRWRLKRLFFFREKLKETVVHFSYDAENVHFFKNGASQDRRSQRVALHKHVVRSFTK